MSCFAEMCLKDRCIDLTGIQDLVTRKAGKTRYTTALMQPTKPENQNNRPLPPKPAIRYEISLSQRAYFLDKLNTD